MSLRTIEEPELRALVTVERAVAGIRAAFAADGSGRTRVPAVINLEVADGEFHVKTAAIDGIPSIAVKIASGFYGNAKRGLPTGSGLMVVFSARTGMPEALLLDNGFLTDIRTGAAGAVAADVLASASVGTVGVIGAGVQARWQLRCLAHVRQLKHVLVWSRDGSSAAACCRDMKAEGFDVDTASSVETLCAQCELVVTATPSREPLVQAAWLRPGMHVTAVGADSPGKQELHAACLRGADLVVADRVAQCASFGELRHAIDAGVFTREGVHAELGEIVAGRKPGRTSAEQITIADLTGVGFQDTAIAHVALSAADGRLQE